MLEVPTLYQFEIIVHSIKTQKMPKKAAVGFRLFDYPLILIYPKEDLSWNVGKACCIALTWTQLLELIKTNFLYLMFMEISAPHSNMIACARLDLNSLKNYVTRNVFKRGNVELYDPVANPIATIDLSMKICVKQSAVQQIQTQADNQKQMEHSQEENKVSLEQNSITHQQIQQITPQQQPLIIKKEQQVSHQLIDKVIQVDQQHQEISMKENKIKELENQIKIQKEQYDQLLRKQRSNVQQQKPSFYKFDYQPPPLFFKNEQEHYDQPKQVQKQKQQKQQKQTTQVQSPIVVEQQEFTENNILDKLIQELLEIKVKQEKNIQQSIYQKPSEQKISKHGRIHHVKDQKVIKRQQESEVLYSQDFEKDSVEFRRSNEVATPQPPSQYSSDFESVTLSREKLKCPLCNEKHLCSKMQEAPQAFSQYSSDFESMTLSRDKLKCPLCNEAITQSQIQQHVCSKIQEEEEIESVSESIYSSV